MYTGLSFVNSVRCGNGGMMGGCLEWGWTTITRGINNNNSNLATVTSITTFQQQKSGATAPPPFTNSRKTLRRRAPRNCFVVVVVFLDFLNGTFRSYVSVFVFSCFLSECLPLCVCLFVFEWVCLRVCSAVALCVVELSVIFSRQPVQDVRCK